MHLEMTSKGFAGYDVTRVGGLGAIGPRSCAADIDTPAFAGLFVGAAESVFLLVDCAQPARTSSAKARASCQ
jgi:hypothetical protein